MKGKVFLLVLMLSLCSCQKEKLQLSIQSVSVSPVADNVLRKIISITFKEDCDYSITYWKKGEEGSAITTNTDHSVGKRASMELLFLYANSTYVFKVNSSDGTSSEQYEFQTSGLPVYIPEYEVTAGKETQIPGYYFTTHPNAKYLLISDTDGNLIWYQHMDVAPRQFDLQLEQGKIWLTADYKISITGDFQRLVKYVICMDLHGNEIHRWNIAAGELDIPYIHHDIRQRPDGTVAVVCNQVKNYDLSTLGGGKDVAVYGDGFAVFDESGKVLRNWDVFNEIDVPTCSYINSVKHSIDIVHANSVNWDTKGNYYMTFNRINQLWKIDGQSGEVLYRVGKNGNVSLDESGYTSGMHSNIPLDEDRVLVLDNGSNSQITRALIYKVNPITKTAEIEMNVALPTEYFATDRSNVELIRNNTMLFFGLTGPGYVVFTDLTGNVLKAIHRDGLSYRAHYFPELPKY